MEGGLPLGARIMHVRHVMGWGAQLFAPLLDPPRWGALIFRGFIAGAGGFCLGAYMGDGGSYTDAILH